MEQGTQEWLEVRKKHLGASDAPCVMGVGYKTPFQLWEEKVGLKKSAPDNAAMKYGREMEPIARREYEKYTNNLMTPEVVFHPTRSFMMASLDGISFDKKIILEVKNTNAKNHELAKRGKIPDEFFPQVQHALDCKPKALLHYWSYHKDNGVLVEVERNEKFVGEYIPEAERFWKAVLEFEPPPLTSRDYIEFVNDQEWLRLSNEARAIAELEKEIKARKERNRKELKTKCDGQSACGPGFRFTRVIKQGMINWNELAREMGIDPSIIEQYRGDPIESWLPSFPK